MASQHSQQRFPLHVEMTVRQVARDYPECRETLMRYGEPADREPFGHLEPLTHFATRRGVDLGRLMNELAQAAGVTVDWQVQWARTVHRPFIVSALVLTLTLGAGWGAVLLWQIGQGGRFDAVPANHIVAHGEAQLWGFIAAFVMGIALRWLPMATSQPAVPRWLQRTLLGLLLVGIVGGFVWSLAASTVPWMGPLSGTALVLASAIFALSVGSRLHGKWGEPWARFVFLAVSSMLVWATLVLGVRWYWASQGPAYYSQPLRTSLMALGVYGLGTSAVYGFGLRLLPGYLGGSIRRPCIQAAYWCHQLGILGLIGGELGASAGFSAIGMLAIGSAAVLFAAGLKGLIQVGQFSARPEQGHPLLPRYIQLALFWLLTGTALLAAAALYEFVTAVEAAHAWKGSARHALTVGFLTTLILGVGQRLLPILEHTLLPWPGLVWPILLLVGTGNLWRVTSELATLVWAEAFRLMPGSAILELTALGLFAANVLRTLWPPTDSLLRTGQATEKTPVRLLLAEHPWLEDPLISMGVRYLARVRSVPAELSLGSLLASEGLEVFSTLRAINSLLQEKRLPGALPVRESG